MVDADQVRLSAAKTIFWKWALGIGVSAVCAGAVVAVERSRMVPPLMVASSPLVADVSPPLEATGTATVGGTPLTTASLDLPITETPPPVTMLPPDKPPAPPKSAISKVFRVREPATTGVAHFNSCLPSCETRDPQIVGLEQANLAPPMPAAPIPASPAVAPIPPDVPIPPALVGEPAAPAMPPLEAAEPIPEPPQKDVLDMAVDGGKHVIRRVEGASNAVVHGTKRALDAAVGLVW
ncbi:hypothetical protein [Pleomorphomonas oryzae]|uniref:hypothetical protein n=1 Tax=Pleomorphomonas oryzae TaxID=261934 RepID=UPI00040832D0|nr:hypothetical protein [Pleomorphomonas oryzae]